MNEAKPDPVTHLDATPWKPGEWVEFSGLRLEMTDRRNVYYLPAPGTLHGGFHLTREFLEDAVIPLEFWREMLQPEAHHGLQGREEGRREGQVSGGNGGR